MQRLDLTDLLLLAEAATGIDAKILSRAVKPSAESALQAPFAGFADQDFYPELHTKAAILCSRIIRNHPLPDGNKRTAYLCMIELIRRNDHEWTPTTTKTERAQIIEALAANKITEENFAKWIEPQITRKQTTNE